MDSHRCPDLSLTRGYQATQVSSLYRLSIASAPTLALRNIFGRGFLSRRASEAAADDPELAEHAEHAVAHQEVAGQLRHRVGEELRSLTCRIEANAGTPLRRSWRKIT